MLHLTTSVSRKTPLDGRLEIPVSLADRLSSTGEPLAVLLHGSEDAVQLEVMACTCAKAGAGGQHVHHFLAGETLRALPAGANVSLDVDLDQGLIRIELES